MLHLVLALYLSREILKGCLTPSALDLERSGCSPRSSSSLEWKRRAKNGSLSLLIHPLWSGSKAKWVVEVPDPEEYEQGTGPSAKDLSGAFSHHRLKM